MSVFAIDMGHTLRGLGTGAQKYLIETNENRKIGNEVIRLLKQEGHTVINCTVDVSNNDLYDRVSLANRQKVDLFVSIHLNAGGGNGTETYIYNGSYSSKEQDRIIASRINNNIVSSCNFSNRGIKEGNFYVLRETKWPAILIEVCFVDSESDKAKLDCIKVAKAIVEGILNKSINSSSSSSSSSNTSNELYRIRKTWADISSQIGAYSDLNNAKKYVDQNPGYKAFNSKGEQVYPIINISTKQYINLKPHMSKWSVYNQNGPYTLAYKVGELAPAQFGGLSYEILDEKGNDVYIIQTQSFGRVGIWAPKDNDSSFTNSPIY